jgi:DNA repair protein RadC
VLKNSKDAGAYMVKLMQFIPTESFFCIFLDCKTRVISTKSFGYGSSNAVAVNNKEIAKNALLLNANSVIIAHNHPANSLEPSNEDLEFTKKLFITLNTIGIVLEDHLIISQNEYRSLAVTNKEAFSL